MERLEKLEMTIVKEDGTRLIRSLEGEEAQKWKEMNNDMSVLAYIRGCNPDWGALSWKEVPIEPT